MANTKAAYKLAMVFTSENTHRKRMKKKLPFDVQVMMPGV